VLSGAGLSIISSKFGSIPAESWIFTPPALPALTASVVGDIVYYALAIVFVAAIESLLCSRMADRLANNTGTKFYPDKELWGQGIVNIVVVLLNGFPHTGALARTATNIKLGAISPLSGIAKFTFKLLLAFYMARYLELVPMACIGGILLYVAMNMVKPGEVTEVLAMGRGHTILMGYTAVAVIATDFLTGVLTALAIYLVWRPKSAHDAQVAREARDARREDGGRDHAHEAPLAMRAELGGERALARRAAHDTAIPTERRAWLSHIRQRVHMPKSSFVHHQANVVGRVVMGEHVHIAAGTSVRADEGAPFFIGTNSNVQDGVIVHALKDRRVRVGGEEWAVYVGRNVSMAHGALVHGPCYIGDDTFIGFKAVVHDSVVGARCFVGIGAVVVGVEIPDGKFVPHGAIIDSAEKVEELRDVTHAQREFNDDVVEVNRGLAAAYREHRDGPWMPYGGADASPAANGSSMTDRF
jgi:SulP family sulfate permease